MHVTLVENFHSRWSLLTALYSYITLVISIRIFQFIGFGICVRGYALPLLEGALAKHWPRTIGEACHRRPAQHLSMLYGLWILERLAPSH